MTSLHPGDTLDNYRIESLVARSGMASIFRGVDVDTGAAIPSCSTASSANRKSAPRSTIRT